MRFELNNGEESEYFTDNETGITYWFGEHEDFCTVCELLNELESKDGVIVPEPELKVGFEEEVDGLVDKEEVMKVIDGFLSKYQRNKERLEVLKGNGNHTEDFSVDVGLAIVNAKYDGLLLVRDKISEL